MFICYKNFLLFIFAVGLLLFIFMLPTYSQSLDDSFKNGGKIRFGRGKSSATVKGVVGANKGILYVLHAKEGQHVTLKITSVGNKARFIFYVVRGAVIATFDIEEYSGDLPKAYGNDYVIAVSTSARKSNFTLQISVK